MITAETKADIKGLALGYLGIFLITADAINGWTVCNFIVDNILGRAWF